MSTILQALQKSRLEQAVNSVALSTQKKRFPLWKVAVSLALLIIIGLLSTLIYLQLKPDNEQAQAVVNIIESKPATEKNKLVKVNFDTQPLMPVATKVAQTVAPSKMTSNTQHVPETSTTTHPQEKISPIDKLAKTDNREQELSYEQVPDELKHRFAQALLLTDIEDNSEDTEQISNTDELNDGSDIHQMSSNFQRKVPAILYDAHVYSSKPEDRWIRINGEKLKEGQFDSSGTIELLEIQPQRSIFRLQAQSFSLESLTDWQGY